MEVMTKKSNLDGMLSFADELVDDLIKSSDEEILAEAAEDCEDVNLMLANLRAEIRAAVFSLGKDRLAEARANLKRLEAGQSNQTITGAESRRLIAQIISSGKLPAGITLAARKDKGNDIVSALSDLAELEHLQTPSRTLNFGKAPKAEFILKDLGVMDPRDIDIEAIAWYLGAKIKYDNLLQCEARIIGANDVAIITVAKNTSIQRQRFSIAHELGHWIYHRKRALFCQPDEIERPSDISISLERTADRFAAELLMPDYLFIPIANSLGRPSLQVVRKLAEIFNTSQTAAAIRLVEINELPLVLVNHGKQGRRWFARSKTVSHEWTPTRELLPESLAFRMIFTTSSRLTPPKSVSASNWFSRFDASRFDVVEESLRISPSEVLTLIAFKNATEFIRSGKY
jgi:IrrE N-terminal-like domain